MPSDMAKGFNIILKELTFVHSAYFLSFENVDSRLTRYIPAGNNDVIGIISCARNILNDSLNNCFKNSWVQLRPNGVNTYSGKGMTAKF